VAHLHRSVYHDGNVSEAQRFFFEPPRFLLPEDFALLPFAALDDLADFLPPLLTADFVRLNFEPRDAPPLAFPGLLDPAFEPLLLFAAPFLAPPLELLLFFEAEVVDLPELFGVLLDAAFTFAETFLTAFRTLGADVFAPAALPANAPSTPPTTAPTGPATLPKTAPVAAPAACLEIGGISMFSDDEPEVRVDCLSSAIDVLLER
jgi:hypothetical protein